MQYAKISWQNNQPYSEDFSDIFFSREGGRAESEYVYLQNNDLPQRWLQSDRFVIGETGFGTGLNFLVTADAWLTTSKPGAALYYFSVEKYPLHKNDLQKAMTVWPEFASLACELLRNWPASVTGYHYIALYQRRVVLVLMLGDVLDMLRQMTSIVDAWYLDGFAPSRNSEMWSPEVLREIARNSHSQTTFSSYTAAGEVKRGLQASGFVVTRAQGFAPKRDMLRGFLQQPVANTDHAPWFALPDHVSTSKNVAIIGAGIAGVTTARSLAQRGWHVDLFDSHASFAMSGSGNPAGVLLPRIAAADSSESEFYAAAFFLALRQLTDLQNKFPETFWQQTGVVQLLSSDRLRKQYDSLDWPDDYVRRMTAVQASAVCGLDLEDAALVYPLAGWLAPQSLCKILLDDAGESVTSIFNIEVSALQRQDDVWVLHDQHQRELGRYPMVVLANAQQALQYEQTAWMNLLPARGQITYMPRTAISQNLLCPVCYDGYVLPATNGYHVIGASFESGNAATDLLPSEHEQNYRKLQQYVPALMQSGVAIPDVTVKGRAAVRAVTLDRMPLVGAVPDMGYFRQHYADLQQGKRPGSYPAARYLPGLFVNAGHGARGLTSAFLAAELVAAMISNDVLPVASQLVHALHPARFFIRQSRKGKLPES